MEWATLTTKFNPEENLVFCSSSSSVFALLRSAEESLAKSTISVGQQLFATWLTCPVIIYLGMAGLELQLKLNHVVYLPSVPTCTAQRNIIK